MAKRVGHQVAVYNAGGITLTDGESTGLFVDANGHLLTSTASQSSVLDSTVSSYLASLTESFNFEMLYSDRFSEGFQGWQYQHDTTGRTGITLGQEARRGNLSLLLHTRAVANDECWARKGIMLPQGLKKVIFGCYWMMHASNANSPRSVKFELDSQDDATRKFFSFRYQNWNPAAGGSIDQKWQVNTGTSATYSDVPGGAETINFNESNKPMLSYMVGVIDYENKRYERLFSNGNEYDLTSLEPSDGAFLADFVNGAVNIYTVQARGDATQESQMMLEDTFLGFVF